MNKRIIDRRTGVESKDLPKFNLGRVQECLPRIRQLLLPLAGRKVTPEEFQPLVAALQENTTAAIPLPRLAGALSILTTLTPDLRYLEFLAERLAGNIDRLIHDPTMSVDPVSAPDGWCAGKILEVEKAISRAGWMRKAIVHAECGHWAGSDIPLTMTEKSAHIVATHIGFSRRHKPLQYHRPTDFTGLRICILVVGNDAWGPRAENYGATAAQIALNRKLIKGRNLRPCPIGIIPRDCEGCPKGQDECPLAIRAVTWQKGTCPVCKKERIMNPRYPNQCPYCRMAQLTVRLKELQSGG
jgi:hypothetical protein